MAMPWDRIIECIECPGSTPLIPFHVAGIHNTGYLGVAVLVTPRLL